ncbi:hypothetical protein [Sinimarinibacterium flocculans]|uniref:hypothetical protein n=1 Tax=Sinimarinibacterium flocculans TaxID=985250 RepID=UPI0035189645
MALPKARARIVDLQANLWLISRHPLAWGVLGLGLVLILALTVLSPASARYAALQAESVSAAIPVDQERIVTGDPLADFYGQFPSRASLPGTLAKLDALIHEHGLLRERSAYRDTALNETPLMAHDVDMFVRGPYPDVRKFLIRALSEIPHLALTGVTFSRSQPGDPEVEMSSTWRLYLRD